ncbi:hypothetical protein ScPMuIL_017846 [Solemya velum]
MNQFGLLVTTWREDLVRVEPGWSKASMLPFTLGQLARSCLGLICIVFLLPVRSCPERCECSKSTGGIILVCSSDTMIYPLSEDLENVTKLSLTGGFTQDIISDLPMFLARFADLRSLHFGNIAVEKLSIGGNIFPSMPALSLFCVLLYAGRKIFWHYTLKQKLQKYKKSRQEGDYAVFVSYSHEDGEWVLRKLYPVLESKLQQAIGTDESLVFLNDKDFEPGSYITEEIIRGIAVSRTALFIISDAFIESQWCELETAVALKDKKPILLLLKHDINLEKLQPTLRKLYNLWVREKWPNRDDERLETMVINRLVNSILNNIVKTI